MITYKCEVCGHVEFNAAPEKCLVCRADGSAFIEDAAAINLPADAANLTEAEKKHVPQIVVVKDCGLLDACTDVHVKVGEIPHVMTDAHFISYIDAYVDDAYISRIWLSPAGCNAGVGFHLSVSSGKFTAVEGCNVHGAWMAEVQL